MNLKIEELFKNFNLEFDSMEKNKENLSNLKNKYLSRNGLVASIMQEIREIPNEEKPSFGSDLNNVKNEIIKKIEELEKIFLENSLNEKMIKESLDINIPGDDVPLGFIHPLNQILDKVKKYFIKNGYTIADGPEVESDEYNFERMNIPKNHPARAMQDSFYFDLNTLLRTHTSPVQARIMEKKNKEPIKLICPGKVYRRDYEDSVHSHQFMQIEGLCIGKGVNFINLRETIVDFLKYLFGADIKIRIRPSYFPFTEPSIEVDMLYKNKNGETKYIEILGAGMVHPNVLNKSGYEKSGLTGFAFGIGVERIAMIYYEIDDIRYFYQNDIRFLKQFKEEF